MDFKKGHVLVFKRNHVLAIRKRHVRGHKKTKVSRRPLFGFSTVCISHKAKLGDVPVSEMGRHGSPRAPDGWK